MEKRMPYGTGFFIAGVLAIAFWVGTLIYAFAGSVTVQIVQGGFPNANRSVTISDDHIARIIVAYQQEANTAVNGTATRAQVLNYWFQKWLNNTINDVREIERKKQIDAVPEPTPIEPQ